MFALLVAAYVIVLDQVTKEWIRAALGLHESIPVWESCFHVTYVKNTGAAWGMFSGQNLVLIALAAAMLVAMTWFRRRIFPRGMLGRLAYGLLAGGIAGNLLDRLRLDFVTDYLDFHVGGWHWPAFNVADAAITLGVMLFMGLTLWNDIRAGRKAKAADADGNPA